ncbi:uncharacterized protein LOC128017810 [Carassius gibelio]|uniref:uncharacterized protein LOC128017810 n=1 Tax=Carassius gibelio TaxID=101364 RepID=UPI002277617E|nr:uncharacterized protein LOC128017810 [Carassius gibelio]XP_052459336.1 uncharacterized protein LOC128017810 [Carassius gibelio]XP_052459337.1 uncharacterized protein LOC128017810 [Carassius gibelio]XP_052459339.1 uncharacterized protein LOC128017810 [Carassius gibelio]XP_052459340.1 uncharacterized protein LOC128017810 [Carassius gibelio]XP_052459341.1 uncharacterized protein LOC128017810 [Carassius gibelio]XP_052459342.1 uncharacterized protein LOC128017810 [Carassius gibelio]XP_05245934
MSSDSMQMHLHQSDSDSSDDSMKDRPFMSSIMKPQRRRPSMDEPTEELSDIIRLREELNRLHKKITPECNEHIKKMTDVVNEFEKDYRLAFYDNIRRGAGIGMRIGVTGMVLGLALAPFTLGASLVVAGVGAAAAIIFIIGKFKKEQQEKKSRQTIEKELEELQKKISPIINMLEKIYDCTQKILRNPKLSEHKVNARCERFSSCFEKTQLFQRDRSRAVGAQKDLTGDLSETFAEMSYVLKILEEIIEDKEEQNDNDKPEETPADKQIDEEQFKKKAETFIDEMKKGINELQNVMNEVDQIKKRLLKK